MAITKVTEGVRTLGTGEVATANMATDPTNASNLASGTVGSARMGSGTASASTILYGDGSWKTEPAEYNDAAVLNDIATLALHSAVQNNQAAYNLSNAFIDQFEDSSGIDVLTDVVRNSSEYMTTISGTAEDSNTVLLLHCDGANDGTTFTDSATGGNAPHTVTAVADAHTDTSEKKFGTASAQLDGTGDYLSVAANSDFQWSTGEYTIDLWAKQAGTGFQPLYTSIQGESAGDGPWWGNYVAGGWFAYSDDSTNSWEWTNTQTLPVTAWTHYALTRDGGTQRFYMNGVQQTSATATTQNSGVAVLFGGGYGNWNGYLDEIRVSDNVCRYPNGTTFSVPTEPYGLIDNATGNYTSTTETASATVSEMGIVVLYKNAYGTAALNTDLIAAVSADGGSNYTTTTLTAAGTFSTGINIAVANGVSISNTGTAPKYKISFANQSASSKETQVYGVALLY